jgi:hypothetical protein
MWVCGARNCPSHAQPDHRCPHGVWRCSRQACLGHQSPGDRCQGAGPWHCGARRCPTHRGPDDHCPSGVWICGRSRPPCPGHGRRDHRCVTGAALIVPPSREGQTRSAPRGAEMPRPRRLPSMGIRQTRPELLDASRRHLANSMGRLHAVLLYLCREHVTSDSVERLLPYREQCRTLGDSPCRRDGHSTSESEIEGMIQFALARDDGLVVRMGDGWTSALTRNAELAPLLRDPGFQDHFDRGYASAYEQLHPHPLETAAVIIAVVIASMLVELALAGLTVGIAIRAPAAASAMVRAGQLGAITVRNAFQKLIQAARRLFARRGHVPQGATEIVFSRYEEYLSAISRTFPEHHFDDILRLIDDIGAQAGRNAATDAEFVRLVRQAEVNPSMWNQAGTRFHTIARDVTRGSAGRVPPGWTIEAEVRIGPRTGGSRLDVLFRGPAGESYQFDWKPTWQSGVSAAAEEEMTRHAAQLPREPRFLGTRLVLQESRSWVDYVRPHMRGVNWPRPAVPRPVVPGPR